jgi:hypothetical protein
MQTFSHFSQHFAAFFLEWEMFQINIVENIKTNPLCSAAFSGKSYRLWHNVEKFSGAREDAENMAPTHGILDK